MEPHEPVRSLLGTCCAPLAATTKWKVVVVLLVGGMMTAFPSPVTAESGARQLLLQAVQAYEEGVLWEAERAAHQALIAISRERPLHVERKALVVREASTFGDVEPHPTGIYAAGDRISVYIELSGVDFDSDGDDAGKEFDLNLTVKNAAGRVGLQESTQTSMRLKRQIFAGRIYFDLFLELTKAPPGNYVLAWKITDRRSGEHATALFDIEVR